MSAALPTNTPIIDIAEIMLIACTSFREKRYLLAIYTEVFKLAVPKMCDELAYIKLKMDWFVFRTRWLFRGHDRDIPYNHQVK